MAEDTVSKLQVELDLAVKNLKDLEATQTRLSTILDLYRKIEDASAKAARITAPTKGTVYERTPQVSERRDEARRAVEDIKRRGSAFDPTFLSKTSGKLVLDLEKELADLGTKGSDYAKTFTKNIGEISKRIAEAKGKHEAQLDAIVKEPEKVRRGNKQTGISQGGGGLIAEASKRISFINEQITKAQEAAAKNISDVAKQQKGSLEKKTRAAKDEAKAVKDAADLGTAEAKKVVSATKEASRAREKISQSATREAAAVTAAAPRRSITQIDPGAAQRRELLSQLGSRLRSTLGVAAQSPFGRAYGPTMRELRGAQLPLADRRLIGAGGALGAVNTQALQSAFAALASSADRAAANLARVAAAPAGGGAAGGGGGMPAFNAGEARLAQSVIGEMLAFPKAWSQVHGAMRFNEAQFNKDYGKELEARNARATAAYNKAIASMGNVWQSSAQGARSFRAEQDGILGQVKNVIGLAAGYQVLQGIATELGQVFGHLKGGIVGYNAMIEQATVGFTTLFQNQADRITESTAAFDYQKDVIDYLAMGYQSAGEAAEAMIITIKDFANVTPFRFPELQESALRMRAFGFGMQEILVESKNAETGMSEFSGAVVSVGNAVAALGGGADAFRRITYALGQMKQAGRVYQNDMMQLANAGIGGYKYIADALRNEITEGNTGRREDVKKGYEKLYDELSANAIETVRRLTTNGQISGEAAARAIMDGMNKEFANGMEAQSKTFLGALSTVADVSQSLVAESFEPMFKSISAITYQFGQFLQRDEAKAFAMEMQGAIRTITVAFGGVGETVSKIVLGTFRDFKGAIDKAAQSTTGFAGIAGASFKFFASGIGAIGDALSNDYMRAIALAAAATKALFAFSASNPFLTQVLLLVSAIGLFKTAYDQNILGVQKNFDKLFTSIQPLVKIITQDLLPALGNFATIFGAVVVDTIIVGFKAIEPALTVIIRAFAELIKIISRMEGPIAVAAIAMASIFVGNKIISGISAISRKITELLFKYDQLAIKAKIAAESMRAAPGMMVVGQQKYRMATDPKTGKRTREYYYTGETATVPKSRGTIDVGNTAPTSRVFPGIIPFGKSVLGTMPGAVGGGLLGASILGDALGLPAEITSLAGQIGTALFGFEMLKNIVPEGTFDILKKGVSRFADVMVESAKKIPFDKLVKGFSSLYNVLGQAGFKAGSSVAARLGAGAAGTLLTGQIVAAIAAVGGVAAIVAIAVGAFAYLLHSMGILPKGGTGAPKKGSASYNYLFGTYNTGPNEGSQYTTGMQQGREAGQYQNIRTNVTQMEGFVSFREGERNMEGIADATEETNVGMDAVNKKYGLLINQQKQAAGNQELLNLKLQRARDALNAALQKYEQLATAALERLMNPESRMNPYTGLEEVGITAEEVLEIEQEMSTVQFTNAQGLVRSFDEYRDILVAIKPLTEADLTNGRLNLKAVNERLKIEKERRKEQERIKALAEAEYDLGLAVLSQYDESIDPLQRAVQMRSAQMKYEEDITKLRYSGLENVVSEAMESDVWTMATRATKKRLEDLRKGQELVLNEMRDMFQKYNDDIAFILANPNLSAATKSRKIEELFAEMRSRLGSDFGLTEKVLKDQVEIFNGQIKSVVDAANGVTVTMPAEIAWTQSLLGKVKAGLDGLTTMMENKAARIAELVAMIKRAASDSTDSLPNETAQSIGTKLSRVLTTLVKSGRMSVLERSEFERKITSFKTLTDIAQIRERYSTLYGLLTRAPYFATNEDFALAGFAKGGVMPAGKMALVGEQGPELVIPQQKGLVINNGLTSRIMRAIRAGKIRTDAGVDTPGVPPTMPPPWKDDYSRDTSNPYAYPSWNVPGLPIKIPLILDKRATGLGNVVRYGGSMGTRTPYISSQTDGVVQGGTGWEDLLGGRPLPKLKQNQIGTWKGSPTGKIGPLMSVGERGLYNVMSKASGIATAAFAAGDILNAEKRGEPVGRAILRNIFAVAGTALAGIAMAGSGLASALSGGAAIPAFLASIAAASVAGTAGDALGGSLYDLMDAAFGSRAKPFREIITRPGFAGLWEHTKGQYGKDIFKPYTPPAYGSTIRKRASGGSVEAMSPYLVGERGPEIVLPQSRGLVLNNSVSSRILGMLGGVGSSSSQNVIINVNNPVVRSDNDIRKLAQEISRVQASQFRTEGGRL
jgi:hypothetical protein